jgi:AraC-like DNA-binding protein
MARRSTGHPVRPAAVRFAFPRPADTGPHEALFQAPLTFDHPRNELELDAATLRLPQRQADPWLRELVERHAGALIQQLRPPGAFAARVSAALSSAIQSGTDDLASVAGALAVSERTLQRRLAAEGVAFRALADEARRHLACQYLADGMNLAEIALVLGFSEQAAFQQGLRALDRHHPGPIPALGGVIGQSGSPRVKTVGRRRATIAA